MSAAAVPPATLVQVLDAASAAIWQAQRNLENLPHHDPLWLHWHGRQCGLIVLLQRCAALPVGPVERSAGELRRALAAARPQLPDGFKDFSAGQAHQWLAEHGVQAALNEIPNLQRHLLAGQSNPAPVSAADAGCADQQGWGFLQFYPSHVADVVRQAPEHIPQERSPMDDAACHQRLDSAIINAQRIAAPVLGHVEPQNLLFIFAQTAQTLAHALFEVPPGFAMRNLATHPLDGQTNEQTGNADQQRGKNRAVVFYQLRQAQILKPLGFGSQGKSTHSGYCHQLGWFELERLRTCLLSSRETCKCPFGMGCKARCAAHSCSYGQVPQRRRPPEWALARPRMDSEHVLKRHLDGIGSHPASPGAAPGREAAPC